MAEKITFDLRRYKRKNIEESPFSVRIKTQSVKLRADKEIEGFLANIGAGGALLVIPIFIPRGAIIDIEISHFDDLQTPLKTNSKVIHHEKPHFPLPLKTSSRVVHTQGRVISLKKDKDEHLYCMGVEFLNVSDEVRSTINEWVEKMSENTAKAGGK